MQSLEEISEMDPDRIEVRHISFLLCICFLIFFFLFFFEVIDIVNQSPSILELYYCKVVNYMIPQKIVNYKRLIL